MKEGSGEQDHYSTCSPCLIRAGRRAVDGCGYVELTGVHQSLAESGAGGDGDEIQKVSIRHLFTVVCPLRSVLERDEVQAVGWTGTDPVGQSFFL